jgi:hypothetical protein
MDERVGLLERWRRSERVEYLASPTQDGEPVELVTTRSAHRPDRAGLST